MRTAKHGYLIVLKPEVFSAGEEKALATFAEYADKIREMQHAFASFVPANYRGTAREPLEAAPSDVVELFELDGCDFQGEKPARARFDEIIDKSDDYDNNLIERLADARDIFGWLENADRWEIIEVRRDGFDVGPTTLGFDIGCWSGAYSIIADTILIPQWHPPAREDYAEVVRELSSLNEHLLFSRPEDAERYLAYYRSKSWAEKEGREGAFCIIQVDAIALTESE